VKVKSAIQLQHDLLLIVLYQNQGPLIKEFSEAERLSYDLFFFSCFLDVQRTPSRDFRKVTKGDPEESLAWFFPHRSFATLSGALAS